jgi:hypothetical protein
VIPCAKLSNLDERWGILSIELRVVLKEEEEEYVTK